MKKIIAKVFETCRKDKSTGRNRSGAALTIRKGIPHSLVAPKGHPNEVDGITVEIL